MNFLRPPWIVATIVTLLNAYHADRTGERYLHIAVPWWGVIVGYIIGLSTMVTGGRYVAMFLMASGYVSAISAYRIGILSYVLVTLGLLLPLYGSATLFRARPPSVPLPLAL